MTNDTDTAVPSHPSAADAAVRTGFATGRVQLTEHSVPLPGLSPGLDGLRVLQLSDLHVGRLFRSRPVRLAVSLINACRPDLIVLTGDFVSHGGLRHLKRAAPELSALRAPLGVFACLGNHEYWEGVDEVRAILDDAGVPTLVNDSAHLADHLWVAGVDDLMSGEPDLERTMADVPDGSAVVLLSHNPMILPQVADRPWLILAGHTHGGQVALPFLGPRATARVPGLKWLMHVWEWSGVRRHGGRVEAIAGARYPAGWYQEGRARMYVNRGFGFNQTWPIRLNCPAEIACFTLRTAGAENGVAPQRTKCASRSSPIQ